MQPVQHLTLEIIDYPGEWLLDLPLLEQSLRAVLAAPPWRWPNNPGAPCGRRGLARAGWPPSTRRPPRTRAPSRTLAEAYPPLSPALPARAGPEPGPARAVHQSRRPRGLAAAAVLPAAARRDSRRAPTGLAWPSASSATARRWCGASTRSISVRFDRQIVLVDLLGALNAGPAHFADTQESLALILKSFRYGSTGLLARLFAPRIDRLLFAVSKADHVAPEPAPGAQAAARADDPARPPARRATRASPPR